MNETTDELMFETPRLSVRHFQKKDLDDFAALCADPEVMRYVGDGTTSSRAEVAHWIEVCQTKYQQRGYGTSAVFEKSSDRFIGYCGVVRAPEHDFDELIYVFHSFAWGKGYATEMGQAMLQYVFEKSTLDKIYATIHGDNEASVKVVQKLGMTFEKRKLEPDGTYTLYYTKQRGGYTV
jgi:[ribosomal protein S5]-alanine N-acetyltransferase